MANELSTTPQSDNFAIAAAGARVSAIVGDRIRFSKGRYLIGRGDGVQLSAGTELRALDIACAWVKFRDGRVVDQRVGFPMCERDELDDNDPDEWPEGYDGTPQDPWSNQRFLYLIDARSGREYTFVTSSWSGRGAVEQLVRQIFIKRQTTPGAVAVVKLEAAFKNSPKYGAIPCPKFDIVGWVGDEPANSARTVTSRAPLARELDDEIPFITCDPMAEPHLKRRVVA